MKIDGFGISLWHAQSTFLHFCNNLLDGKYTWFQKLGHYLHNRHFRSICKSPIASSYWRVQPNHTYNYKLLRHLKCLQPIPIFIHYPMNIESFDTKQGFRVSKIWFFSLHFPVHSFWSSLMHSSFPSPNSWQECSNRIPIGYSFDLHSKSTLHTIASSLTSVNLFHFYSLAIATIVFME